jgi:hypothetical protein
MPSEVMSPEKQATNTAPPASQPDPSSPPFSEDEWKMLRAEDFGAARLVVGIMGGVFTMGLLLYIVIAYMVSMGPS